MPADLSIRPLHTVEEFHRCVEVARAVWADSELDTEPHITFVIADHTGGQVLGAFDGQRLIGFIKAVVGVHGTTPYLHSHMTGVLPEYRDRHIGRLLKLYQREDALRRGIRLIEWTFDPLETKNAHFNLNRLGGICRHYLADFYGITTSPLHRGMPTDRLLVEWQLDTKRVHSAIQELTRVPSEAPASIHIPKSVPTGSKRASSEETALRDVQTRISAEFHSWFSKGYAATGIRFSPSGAEYCLVPWSDF